MSGGILIVHHTPAGVTVRDVSPEEFYQMGKNDPSIREADLTRAIVNASGWAGEARLLGWSDRREPDDHLRLVSDPESWPNWWINRGRLTWQQTVDSRAFRRWARQRSWRRLI